MAYNYKNELAIIGLNQQTNPQKTDLINYATTAQHFIASGGMKV